MIQFPWIVILIVISVFMIYLVQKVFRISNREVKRLSSVNSGKVLSVIGESCKGLMLIRAFGRQKVVLKEYMDKLNDSMNTFLISQAISVWMQVRLMLISNLIFACVALSSAVIILFNMNIQYNTVAMCLTYSMLLSVKFSDFMYFVCSVEQNMVSVERVRQYFDNLQEEPDTLIQDQTVCDKASNSLTNDNDKLNQTSQDKGSNEYAIEFKGVYISYDDIKDKEINRTSQEVQFALKDVNLQIRRGEKIAFCGRTGSGKTSILNSLFSMYPIQFGSIFVNGQNIRQLSLRQLREQMSIIPQFGFLYKASLHLNLDPSQKILRSEIKKKVDATNLHIRDHKESSSEEKRESNRNKLKNGKNYLEEDNLDFQIEDGGSNLSNGERQIVNFLRIILRETDILCLDEATSNMDPKTDAELHRQIFELAKDKTLLVITHRLENIHEFDRVIVLDNGSIVEQGHVSQLVKIEGGFFNRLLQTNI